jgi:hypothetical protein
MSEIVKVKIGIAIGFVVQLIYLTYFLASNLTRHEQLIIEHTRALGEVRGEQAKRTDKVYRIYERERRLDYLEESMRKNGK